MRTRSVGASLVALPALVAGLVLAVSGGGAGAAPPRSGASWAGLAGAPRPHVALGQRMIVVLRSPSLADRVARAGGLATDAQERRWTSAALAAQNVLISRLGVQGVRIRTEFRYARVLNGFSAALDPRALSLLERAPEVAGVYPVRAAYPASVSTADLRSVLALGGGHRPVLSLPGYDGRGVTIALLDTGVDRTQPFLRGRVAPGIDVVGGNAEALAAPKPDDQSQLERHGTEMAGVVVGGGGPYGLAGVATGASVLPIRVAGWQQNASGGWSIYARSDQILAGLENAVDPNGDDDAHDAARVALVALAEPYAAFADDPIARAAGGATRLDTLVVVPAGNDGPAGPGFGFVSGPGGGPAALTVGAADMRNDVESARVVVRIGLRVVLDRPEPVAGAPGPSAPVSLTVAAPRPAHTAAGAPEAPGAGVARYFDRSGSSRVAGRAALVDPGDDPVAAVEDAGRAGASAVLVSGGLPSGSLGLDASASIPVVDVPASTAARMRAALRRGASVGVAIGRAHTAPNPGRLQVAPFSSTGLAFDGRVKPELVAPGVALATSQPGAGADGVPRYATVNGTSAAAAVVAGAAALLAQARPALGAPELRSLLAETARPIPGASVTAQGAGRVDPGAAAAAELAVEPTSLALGRATGAGWNDRQTLVVQNVSTRDVTVRIHVERRSEGAASIRFALRPVRLVLARGASREIRLRASVASAPVGTATAEGAIVVGAVGGQPLRIPWAITFGKARRDLLGDVSLSSQRFKPSDAKPVVLTVQAGKVLRAAGRDEVQPLERLDISLWNARGVRLGLLARLRDVLPGRFEFGITGRSPAGAPLARGAYQLRIVAKPTTKGPATRRSISFRIR
jgi:subtilisin family serine protease